MPFIIKQSCTAACVLPLKFCPPHNMLHDIDHYPCYYDPLYFPKLHFSVFESAESVKVWLLVGIDDHKNHCQCCHYDYCEVCVDIGNEFIQITIGSRSVLVSHDYIESVSFTFCCLVRLCVLEGSEHSPLDNNPAWLFYPDSHHKENLEHITVPV